MWGMILVKLAGKAKRKGNSSSAAWNDWLRTAMAARLRMASQIKGISDSQGLGLVES
jgi:hypothetical protein